MLFLERNMLYHFLWKYLTSSSIGFNLGNIININGIKTLEIQGSFKYKSLDFSSFSQKESLEFLDNKYGVDKYFG